MGNYAFGLIGLGVMGANFARNLARNGYSVAGFDLNAEQREAFNSEDEMLKAFDTQKDFVKALQTPRKIILLVPSSAVDAVIDGLASDLSKGDLVIDLGNSHYAETEQRNTRLQEHGLLFIGSGVSGGAKGALEGPSIMPGGQPDAYELIKDAFEAAAAKVGDDPCVTYIGPLGSGHFVKMVHNGIEYGVMQSIAEAYDLLKRVTKASNEELHKLFSEWNSAELDSFLVEITADIFTHKDGETGKDLIDLILDEAKQKGTGKWTTQTALDVGVATPTINASVDARILSGLKEERVRASTMLETVTYSFAGDREEFFEQVRAALYASIVCAYAQGMAMMQRASSEFGYGLNLADIAKIWRGGCIIRSVMLEDIRRIYADQPQLPNLILADPFRHALESRNEAWRSVLQTAIAAGIPTPAMSASLMYYDAYRTGRLPANLVQAQRDYFGSHTYRRIDKEGTFHTTWQV